MDIELARDYCLQKRGAEESLPFDENTLVFKVCGKIFAVIALEKPDRIILKLPPSLSSVLRERYEAVATAPYFNKNFWCQIMFGKDICDDEILSLIDCAYGETLRCLPKKTQIAFFSASLAEDIIHIHKNTCKSTMEECGLAERDYPASRAILVTADLQKSGRGQRGNYWESENGKNLLFSFSFLPGDIPANRQFLLSQIVSIATLEAIASALPHICENHAEKLSIKWPNDIYYEDEKLGGILIEHTIEGSRICRTTVGIGLNINQELFTSDAPNPISLLDILGFELPRFVILEKFFTEFYRLLPYYTKPDDIKEAYMKRLYRRRGLHCFCDAGGCFTASIEDVREDGLLALRREYGTVSFYSFKEVSFVINQS